MSDLDAFLAANIAEFGLAGTNNAVPADVALPELPTRDREFSRDKHFSWGFGAGTFSRRLRGAERYWTDYGRPRRPHDGFRSELVRALGEIADRHGTISITGDGGHVSDSAIAAAKAAGIAFEQIIVVVEGFATPHCDASLPTRVHRVSQAELRRFAETFAADAGCSEPWLALEALHGMVSPFAHVYDGTEIRLVNNSYDSRRNAIVGPANWSMVDSEQYTGIDRYLILQDRPGFSSILRWSPELMAAQLDSPQWRDWLRDSSRPGAAASRTTWLNQTARLQLSMTSFPGVPMTISMAARRQDPPLGAFMHDLGQRLSRRDPSVAAHHFWPLDRLALRLGICFDFSFGDYREIYGDVSES